MRNLLLCLPLLAGAAAPAQVTSPSGFDTVEGSMFFIHWAVPRRFQQLDSSGAGAPRILGAIAWRREGNLAQGAAARTLDLQVDMGHADFGAIRQKLDDNYLAGSRTRVFNQTRVAFPDWSANLGAPAPFDFQILLAAPFAYNGTDALVIDFSTANISQSSAVLADREFLGNIGSTPGTALGTGCVASGAAAPFTHAAYMDNFGVAPTPAYGMRYRAGGANAPPNAPVLLFLDYQDRNLAGVLCSTVHALPTAMLVLAADASGLVPDLNLGFTHDASLAGGTFYSQLLAVDLGQAPLPVVVSNGQRTTMPALPTPGHRCSYGWYSLPGANGVAITAHFVGGGMVMRLQ